MHKFASKFESTYHKIIDRTTKSDQPHSKTQPHTPPSSEQDFYRHRKQRGVNLGSWFVLERWITDEPFQFAAAPGQSDLDVARGAQAKMVLERHWDTWITETDWSWIAHCGLNTVRIPIGYYHLCGIDASALTGTDFVGMEGIFSGAWKRIVSAIQTAHQFGIGVLIDLHAAPGKQNRDSHAGTSNPPRFFDEAHHRAHTIQVLRILVTALLHGSPPCPNIVGVEVLNEPQPSDDGLLQSWYSSVMGELRSLDPSLPIYLSDCWKTDGYAQYIQSASPTALTVLDHHLYRCFTGADISIRARDHTRALTDPEAETPKMLSRVSSMLSKARGAIIIGEWSGALNPGSLTGEADETKNYITAQLDLYEKYCAGWFFWTYKKQHSGDIGWSFKDAGGRGAFPQRVGLQRENNHSPGDRAIQRDSKKSEAFNAHVSYWSQYPGHYEHWRFGDGFVKGWDDAYHFFNSGLASVSVPELGFVGAWMARYSSSDGKCHWEFEHGFNQGLRGAREDYLGLGV